MAFYYQLVLGELPCLLCALQRVGFVVAGVGLMLNLRSGLRSRALRARAPDGGCGGSASLRQIALHVVPATGSYGSALFGIHFYTWAFVGYGALIVYVGVMLLLRRQGCDSALAPAPQNGPSAPLLRCSSRWPRQTSIAFLLECGVGPCPDDPAGYRLLPGAR